MKRVLFVDDEPDVLNGLRRALMRRRGIWHMVFEAGPELALARLTAERFDVVVSDLHMPRISGIELLQRVAASHPETICVVLSGTADLREAEAIADHVLAKPCDAACICNTIEAALAAKDAA
jgi:DNA-binding NtrC family response regulator